MATPARHWFEVMYEIDVRVHQISHMLARDPTSPVEIMIDRATGFDLQRFREAAETLRELADLWDEYQVVTGQDWSQRAAAARKTAGELLELIEKEEVTRKGRAG